MVLIKVLRYIFFVSEQTLVIYHSTMWQILLLNNTILFSQKFTSLFK